MGIRGGSCTLLKPFDQEVVAPLSAKLFALFRLSLPKMTLLMTSRAANPDFDQVVFDEWFIRLSPKVSAFFQAEDAMRQDDPVGGGDPIADDPATVWPLAPALVDAYQ